MTALRVSLRIARREALRAKGRSALVIAMIGLPVIGVGATDVLYRSFQLTPEQTATRTMGQADAVLEDTGQESVTQPCAHACGYDSASGTRTGPAPSPLSVLPAGSRVVNQVFGQQSTVSFGGATVPVQATDTALADPLTRGIYLMRSGREPRGVQEVALSRALATRLGVSVRDTVRLAGRERQVVGLIVQPAEVGALLAVVPPGTLASPSGARLLVKAGRPLTWTDVRALNARGFFVEPRHDVAGQPPTPIYGSASSTTTALTAVSLVVGMALLEIVLLAGPAFAVGARRRSRDLALLAATGAQARDLRRTVLGGGLVLGAVGGILGVAGGVVLAYYAEPAVSRRTNALPGPFEARPLELLAVLAVGILTALLAAVLPARQAARQDVVAALTGRRGTVRSRAIVPLLGLAAALLGTAIVLAGASRRSINTILTGSIIAELGLVATTPYVVGQVGRLGRFLPLGPRLALRDGARNRGRTAPAISAILAAVAGSVAVGTYFASLDRYGEQSYRALAPYGTTSVLVGTQAAAATAQRVLTDNLPEADVTLVRAVEPESASQVAVTQPCEGCPPGQDFLVGGRHLLVGDLTTLRASTGRSAQELASLARILARGGAVVPAAALASDGTAELTRAAVGPDGLPTGPATRLRVPAAALPSGGTQEAVLSEALARRLGATVGPAEVVATASKPPTSAQEDRIRSGLATANLDSGLQIERGYVGRYAAGLLALLIGSAVIVLGASAIATGLAAADGRADLSTLAAVGASPNTRRTLAAFQSAVTAGLGTLLGTIAGVVPAVGMVRALNATARTAGYQGRTSHYPLVLPWHNLLVTVLVVPLVAALAAALLTRSRLPMVRRIA